MSATQEQMYKYHVENLRRVDRALVQIARIVKIAIRAEDNAALNTYRPLYFMLIGVLSECRFYKLIYEPGFNDDDRLAAQSPKSQFDKWQALLAHSFKKHYKPAKGRISETTLPFSAYSRYKELNELLNNELKDIIELRNKLAHGQWAYPFNSNGNDIESEKCRVIRNENSLSLQYKKRVIGCITDMMHDLVVSKDTFERDFDEHHSQLNNIRRDMEKRNYNKWVESLRQKYRHGLEKRRSTIKDTS